MCSRQVQDFFDTVKQCQKVCVGSLVIECHRWRALTMCGRDAPAGRALAVTHAQDYVIS